MSERMRITPSPKYRIHMWIVILIIFVLTLPFVLFGLIPEFGLIYVLLFMVGSLLWVVPACVIVPFYIRSIEYEFTDREIIVRRGIITRSEDTVPYHQITNIDMRRGPIARTLDIGSLEIHTAGYSGQHSSAEAKLQGLENWAEVYQQLLELIQRSQREKSLSTPALESTLAGADQQDVTVLLTQILRELQAMRSELTSD